MAYRILVVDDEPDLEILITQRFRKRIRAEELSFLFAGNGEEALAKLQADGELDVVLTDINMPVMDGLTLLSRIREAHPLILSDINMPGMSGLELLKTVKEKHGHLKVYMITAYGNDEYHRRAKAYGCDDYLTKPIDFGLLKERLLA